VLLLIKISVISGDLTAFIANPVFAKAVV